MAFGSPDLPAVLRDGGYSCHSIEQSFAVEPTATVNPEIVLCSDSDEHTLIVEAKSGANLNPNQLQRYTLISSESLEKAAFTSSASAKSHDLLIVGLAEWEERLLMGSAQVPCPRRILAVADLSLPDSTVKQVVEADEPTAKTDQPTEIIEGMLRIENTFFTERLNKAFNPVLKINWDLIPNNFLPVDHESANWEFAEFIMPELIAAILNGRKTVAIEELAESFIRHWLLISAKYRSDLLERIRVVVRLAAQQRFASYLNYGVKGTSKNEIRLTVPESIANNTVSQRSQLQKCFREFMNDLNSPQIAMLYED